MEQKNSVRERGGEEWDSEGKEPEGEQGPGEQGVGGKKQNGGKRLRNWSRGERRKRRRQLLAIGRQGALSLGQSPAMPGLARLSRAVQGQGTFSGLGQSPTIPGLARSGRAAQGLGGAGWGVLGDDQGGGDEGEERGWGATSTSSMS